MKKETPHARASLLAAAHEGVRRNARGGRGPQFLKRHGGTEENQKSGNCQFHLKIGGCREGG